MTALRRSAIWLFLLTSVSSLFLNATWDIWAQTLIHGLSLVILTLYLVQAAGQKREITFSYTSADIWYLLYLTGISVSYLYSVNQFNTRNELFNHFNYYLFFYLCPLLLAEDYWRDLFLKLLGIAAGLISLIILWQVWSGEQVTGGPLLNANIASGFFVLVLPVLIYRLVLAGQEKKTVAGYGLDLVLIILVLAGLLGNRSLGSWISLYFSMLLFLGLRQKMYSGKNNGWPSKKYILAGLLLSALVIGYFLVAKMREPEVFNRLLWWRGALSMIRDHSLGGVGLGNFGSAFLVYKTAGLNSLYAHNQFLQLWAEIGIFSLLFWLLGFYSTFRESLKKLALQEPQKQYQSVALICGTCGLLVYNLIDYSLSIPAIAIIWWIMFGLLRPVLPARTRTLKLGAYSLVIYIIMIIVLGVIVTKPFIASQRYVSGIMYLRQNDVGEAKKKLASSLALDPLNSQTYGFLSDIAKSEGDLDTAEKYLQKAISLNKYFGPFHHNLALLYEAQDKLPQAIAEAEQALVCHRQKALYHYTLSLLYQKAGRLADAERESRFCQELQDTNPNVEKN
ncbi:MAG: O-antigen ligase family protein [bacterium]|nr:O-antigen ligase family protein [bacterium]